MSLLAALSKAGVLRALDHALAQSLRRLDPDTPDAVLAAAALASLAVAHGHAGFDPARPARLLEGPLPWPDAQAWIAQLQASRWVAQPHDDAAEAAQAPLAWEHGLLYLRRYREYERRLALGLQRIGQAPLERADPAALAPLFAQLFPGTVDAAAGVALAVLAEERHKPRTPHRIVLCAFDAGMAETWRKAAERLHVAIMDSPL